MEDSYYTEEDSYDIEDGIRHTDRERQFHGILLAMLVLTLVFTLLLAVTVPEAIQEILDAPIGLLLLRALVTSLPAGFAVAMIAAFSAAIVIITQFIQAMYHLTPNDAWKLMWRILVGVYTEPPLDPVMRVQEGRPDPDGPEVLHDVGGPGHLTVGHDNAVILARGGFITRVEGATLVRLEAFEKIWDTIDLRPQRRELRVTANTRDGIPVTCRAEVRFRVQRGAVDHTLPTAPPPTFTDADRDTVLRLSTNKVALAPAPGGERRITDWIIFLTNGTFDGEVRNRIEQYRLDELFNPDRSGPALLTLIEQELDTAMRQIGQGRGVHIDQVHLIGIYPEEDLVSEQWLALWRSGWQRDAAQDEAKAKAMGERELEIAKVRARAEMVTAIIGHLENLDQKDIESFAAEVQLKFLDVMRAMAQMDPMVQSTMFQQLENLEHVIQRVLTGPTTTPPPALPPTTPIP